MNYLDIINKVSDDTGISVEVVKEVYKLYWKFIKETIQALPLKENMNEEEFAKLRTNFNIPSLGKMSVTWERLCGCKKRFEYIKNLRKNI